MDEFFFGAKRKPVRRKKSPVRRKKSPVRRKKSPVRCLKGLSISKLRKLAVQNGINIHSNSRRRVNERTGEYLKAKLVSCATLMKRLKEAGLDHLYKSPKSATHDEDLFEELGPHQMLGPCGMNQVYRGGSCHEFDDFTQEECTGGDIMWNGSMNPAQCVRRTHQPSAPVYPPLAEMDFGKRHRAGARPRTTQKHVGVIEVKGRVKQVFKGLKGGLYYMKGKSGDKVYIDKKRLRK